MEDKIRKYVENLFADAAPTKKAAELKEEMILNLTEKHRDLISEGKSPDAAYNIIIAGIGDVSSLLLELEREAESPAAINAQRQKSAVLTSVAIMLYILACLPLIVLVVLFQSETAVIIGIVILFVFAAAATGILVYNSMTKPVHLRRDDSMVEEFREWQSETYNKKQLRNAISSALWCLIVVLYFIISFTTNAWHISWIIFVGGALIESLITMIFTFKRFRGK